METPPQNLEVVPLPQVDTYAFTEAALVCIVVGRRNSQLCAKSYPTLTSYPTFQPEPVVDVSSNECDRNCELE